MFGDAARFIDVDGAAGVEGRDHRGEHSSE
jgi:hypothetical protein